MATGTLCGEAEGGQHSGSHARDLASTCLRALEERWSCPRAPTDITLNATTRTDPEIVLARAKVPDKKEAVVVLDDGASGDAMQHCEV